MISFIVGAVMGSFWCVVADRLPLRMNFWSDRSRCSTCQRPLAFYDLIPIISFIALKGNCRHCHQAIPRHIFVAEWIYGLFFCYLFSFSTATLETKLVALVWFTMAFSLSITDWLYQIIDPYLLYPFAIILWAVLLWQRAAFSWWTWLLFFVSIGMVNVIGTSLETVICFYFSSGSLGYVGNKFISYFFLPVAPVFCIISCFSFLSVSPQNTYHSFPF